MADSRTVRVYQKTWQAEGVVGVTLIDPNGAELPAWEPGAHISLHLRDGLVREYSLCSDPDDRRAWSVAVLRDPKSRGGSTYVHDELPVGALIEVSGPRNAFSLESDASRYVLVAGGIGITPILAMTRDLDKRGRNWSLIYTGRSRSTMAFLNELEAHPRDRVTVHADDEAGTVADIAALLADVDSETLVYCCGPEPLLEACRSALVDPSRLRLERFKAPTVDVEQGPQESFDVVVVSTGQRITVDANTSVLDALQSGGVDVESSCTEGICGTCEIGVVKGDIDHRDFVLTPAEQAGGTTMIACVSRCRSAELVLDL
ncbi:oxidoreductase [Rhodococcus sp. 05-340-1]|uniref:Putative oxidoreductase n=1 Tax=Rhodococcus sp. YK2 TaxID=169536 RepID=Q8L186_9NOCA|nr:MULTISPECIES: PDR/VanB family oxidoreductase [unclassified Rhodococcus (in: high G+C Gram-positive bacteria)]OZD73383.1 oxidoreductase [Rhodococcus sp. 05-340-2]OZD74305.1 oxidoreductase [Rhodococcus sp. 05-340-1]BAC00797.1 putative oxidoreductase [Rhodococcus sp. YK2]